ncbi:MAG: hypothetical protein WBP85_05170 [Terracidiphilus sp.]
MDCCREFAASFENLAAGERPSGPVLRYSLITAADEKIPLSVVHVNNKPQYLVFSWYLEHPLSKHGCLTVETRKQPSPTQAAGYFCIEIGAYPVFPAPIDLPLTICKPSPSQDLAQGAGSVQFAGRTVGVVDKWGFEKQHAKARQIMESPLIPGLGVS